MAAWTEEARIATLFARPMTYYRAAQRVLAVGISFFRSLSGIDRRNRNGSYRSAQAPAARLQALPACRLVVPVPSEGDRTMFWPIFGGLAVLVALVVVWRVRAYINKATVFVPIDPPLEHTFYCDCGKRLFFDRSLVGNRIRMACSCGNVWQGQQTPGDSLLKTALVIRERRPVHRGYTDEAASSYRRS
jgi:hypothetical protein